MIWSQNNIYISKANIVEMIKLIKEIIHISDNADIDSKDAITMIVGLFESASTVVDDCEIIKTELLDDDNSTFIIRNVI